MEPRRAIDCLPKTTSERRDLFDAAELTEKLCALPAVATLDWCDRAAAILAEINPGSCALVIVATIDDVGRIQDLEGVGVSEDADPAKASELRCQAERLAHIGFMPGTLAQGAAVAGAASLLPGGSAWRRTPLGQVFGPEWAEVLAGLTPMISSIAGRSVLVYLAIPAGVTTEGGAGALLRATLPLLARRATVAIGPARSRRTSWLSQREQHVLEQLILGKSVRQIAEEFGRSPHTVHDHVKSLHRKLNASSRGELIARALGFLHQCERVREQSRKGGRIGGVITSDHDQTIARSA